MKREELRTPCYIVQEGKITEDRLDESVRRILELKTEKDI